MGGWMRLRVLIGVPAALLCMLSTVVDQAVPRTMLQMPFGVVLVFEAWAAYTLWSVRRALVRELDRFARSVGLPDQARHQFRLKANREIKAACRRAVDEAIERGMQLP